MVDKHLKHIEATFDGCIEVRGLGLMRGIELDVSIANRVFETLKDRNFLVGLGGAKKNVLRVMPPMCITEEDLDHFAAVLIETMADVTQEMRGEEVP